MLRKARPETKIAVVEPEGAALLAGHEWKPHKIQGWTPDFIPAVLDRKGFDELVTVTDTEARDAARDLASEGGDLLRHLLGRHLRRRAEDRGEGREGLRDPRDAPRHRRALPLDDPVRRHQRRHRPGAVSRAAGTKKGRVSPPWQAMTAATRSANSIRHRCAECPHPRHPRTASPEETATRQLRQIERDHPAVTDGGGQRVPWSHDVDRLLRLVSRRERRAKRENPVPSRGLQNPASNSTGASPPARRYDRAPCARTSSVSAAGQTEAGTRTVSSRALCAHSGACGIVGQEARRRREERRARCPCLFLRKRKDGQDTGPEPLQSGGTAGPGPSAFENRPSLLRRDRHRRPPERIDPSLEASDVALRTEPAQADNQVADDRSGRVPSSHSPRLDATHSNISSDRSRSALSRRSSYRFRYTLARERGDRHERRIRRVLRMRREIARDEGPVRAAVVLAENVHDPDLACAQGLPAAAHSVLGADRTIPGTEREKEARREETNQGNSLQPVQGSVSSDSVWS